MKKIDDFKFVGALFVPFGLAQIIFGFLGSSAIGAESDSGPCSS